MKPAVRVVIQVFVRLYVESRDEGRHTDADVSVTDVKRALRPHVA